MKIFLHAILLVFFFAMFLIDFEKFIKTNDKILIADFILDAGLSFIVWHLLNLCY